MVFSDFLQETLGEHSCQEIEELILDGLFEVENGKLSEEQKATLKAKSEARISKAKALKWLADNDWTINKRVLGEWSEEDPRWQEYVTGRVKARAEIDAADAILNR